MTSNEHCIDECQYQQRRSTTTTIVNCIDIVTKQMPKGTVVNKKRKENERYRGGKRGGVGEGCQDCQDESCCWQFE